jgi:hypothetical protein
MFKEIESITNYGTLYFTKMEYNEEKKTISIPIDRCKIKAIKKIFWGTTTSYKYDKNIKIPVLIVIKNVDSCKIENNFEDPNVSKMRILFGLQINMKDREIFIGSVEENKGKTCYSIELKINKIDLEIADEGELVGKEEA